MLRTLGSSWSTMEEGLVGAAGGPVVLVVNLEVSQEEAWGGNESQVFRRHSTQWKEDPEAQIW